MLVDSEVPRLHEAVVKGDSLTVVQLLEEGSDVNEEYNFKSPLGSAAENGRTEIAAILLSRGCDVNFGDRRMKTPLYIASRQGNLDLVKLLLGYRPNLTLPHVNGNTPLHEAVVRGYADIVKELLAAGCPVNAPNNGKEIPIHIACLKGYTEIAQMLIEVGGNVHATKGTQGFEPIHLAAHGGHVEVLQLLIQAGVCVDTVVQRNRRAPLHIAAINNCIDFVDALLKQGCEIDPISWENDEAKTPLMKAVELGHLDITQKLITAGADIDKGDHWGVTPLVTVMLNGNTEIADILIKAGCDVNLQCKNKLTPFSASLRNPGNSTKLTKNLVVANCILTATDKVLFEKTLLLNRDEEKIPALNEIKYVLCNARSLQHLCRTVMRIYLGRRSELKIKQLCLPAKVKEYLMYSDL